MIQVDPGPLTDRITLLGRRESCVALLNGGEARAVLGGGMTYIVPDVARQLADALLAEEQIERLVILHAHFDHCGIIPWAKRRWPQAVVTASPRAAELLAKDKVNQTIGALNQAATERAGLTEAVGRHDGDYAPITVEQTPADGERIPLGDLTLEVIAAPGHSSCSMAVYVPELRALFPSDAGGIQHGDFHLACGNSNFDQYEASLARLAAYDVDVLVSEHYGAATGEDARAWLPRARREARATRALLEDAVRRHGDPAAAAEEVADRFVAESPDDFLPREILILVAGQMCAHVARSQGLA